jgi:hypothetical protein
MSALEDPEPPADTGEQPADSVFAAVQELRSELAASEAESRRTARRVLEGLRGFSTVLDAIASSTRSLEGSPQPATGQDLGAALMELSDRIDRTSEAFAREPAGSAGFWPWTRKAIAAWRNDRRVLAESIGILMLQKNSLLAQAGLERIPCAGKRFDPACMAASEVVVDAGVPDHTVLSETLPGWREAGGRIIRFAQVRVSRQPAP